MMTSQRNLQIISFSCSAIQQNIDLLDQQTKILYDVLFNERTEVVLLDQILPFKLQITPMPLCNKEVDMEDTSYVCFDCRIHDGLIICKDCFWSGWHKGHRYQQTNEGGTCDCGDKSAMKSQYFCINHSGVVTKPNINKQDAMRFNKIMSQMLSWAIQLQNSLQLRTQIIQSRSRSQRLLLEPLIDYLLYLNQSSPYYIQLTTSLLFDSSSTIHISTILRIAHENLLSQKLYNLFREMLVQQKFKEQMLQVYINQYSKGEWFQSSAYQKLYGVLLLNSEVVQKVMSSNPAPFLPYQFIGNIKDYYLKLLYAVTTLSPAATQAFLLPILQIGFIQFPPLNIIHIQCEQMNRHPINVYTDENILEQLNYYKLLITIISKQKRSSLKVMLRNYYKMVHKYSFQKNRIVLVPQRVFVLLVFKYFDYNLEKVSCQQLVQVLGVSIHSLYQFINKLGVAFIHCLGEFADNVSRTTYFDSYLPIYVKEESQIVLVDYLGIKLIALMSEGFFPPMITELYKKEGQCFNKQNVEQKSKQMVRKWNIIIKILVEICLSPKTEMVLQSFMGVELPLSLSKDILTQLVRKTGELSSKDLQSIKSLFFGGKLSETAQNQCLSFKISNKKFTLRQNARQVPISNPLWTEWFVSLLKTNLNKVVTASQTKFNYTLTPKERKMTRHLVNGPFLQSLLLQQLQTICLNQNDFVILIKELILLVKSLQVFIGELSVNRIMDQIMKSSMRKADGVGIDSNAEGNGNSKIDTEQIQDMIGGHGNDALVKIERANAKTSKHRQLLKLRKAQKLKQMKVSQELTLSNYDQPIQESSQEMCLICREGTNNKELCYIGKLKCTNLLFNILNIQEDQFIFDSCLHTVHYSCFIELTKSADTVFCPLCQVACNTVSPMKDSTDDSFLSIINNQIEVTMSLLKESQQKQMYFQGMKYFGYLILINMESEMSLTERQIKLYRSIFALMKNSYHTLRASFEERCFAVNQSALDTTRDKHKFEYQAYINCISTIFTENMEIEGAQPDTIANAVNQLGAFMTKEQTQYMIRVIHQIISLFAETSDLRDFRESFAKQQSFLRMFELFDPPPTARALLTLRDEIPHECRKYQKQVHVYICIICKKTYCERCDYSEDHFIIEHQSECLFFKTQTGGLLYRYGESQVHIRSLYSNSFGKAWQPQYETAQYNLEKDLYASVLSHLKAGNLFYFLTHTLDDLKDEGFNDLI